MVDNLKKEIRSYNMSRIKSKNTKPEMVIRSLLHSMGLRFRIHRKDLPGTPDVTLPKFKSVIFIHGCYWHRHEGCKYSTDPKTNKAYWLKKFYITKKRDISNQKSLAELGWNVIIVWECQINDVEAIHDRLAKELLRLLENHL